jgi:hypothetical protein
MPVTGHPEGRIVGHVQLKVASRVFAVPVQEARLAGTAFEAGFFTEGRDGFGILVDMDAAESQQLATIEKASEEAAKFISCKLLN